MYPQGHWLSNSKFCTQQIDPVIRINLVVVGRVGKSERKHSLLLEVGLVLEKKESVRRNATMWRAMTYDSSKTPSDDSKTTKVSWFKRSVFS